MKTFEIKKEHLKLLKKAYWDWDDCEYGAPAIDCKRPFGNSDVESDILSILNPDVKRCPHCGEVIDIENTEEYIGFYRELGTVLNIICNTQTFEIGTYEQIDYGEDWIKIK